MIERFDPNLMSSEQRTEDCFVVRGHTSFVATTKGLAAAPVLDCVATKSDLSVLGTTNPIMKTPPT